MEAGAGVVYVGPALVALDPGARRLRLRPLVVAGLRAGVLGAGALLAGAGALARRPGQREWASESRLVLGAQRLRLLLVLGGPLVGRGRALARRGLRLPFLGVRERARASARSSSARASSSAISASPSSTRARSPAFASPSAARALASCAAAWCSAARASVSCARSRRRSASRRSGSAPPPRLLPLVRLLALAASSGLLGGERLGDALERCCSALDPEQQLGDAAEAMNTAPIQKPIATFPASPEPMRCPKSSGPVIPPAAVPTA